MKFKTFEIYDPISRYFSVPRDTVLLPEQIKAMESVLETAKSLRESLRDYFERLGCPMDERACHLDLSLKIRASFLDYMLNRFDKARLEKHNKEVEERLKVARQEMRNLIRQTRLGWQDWYTVYGG